MSSLFSSQIHYLFREFTLNSLFSAKPLWIHYLFRYFTLNSLSYSLNHYEFTSCFAKSIQIHYLFRKFTLNPFFPAKSLWMNYLLSVSLWIYYIFREFTTVSTSRFLFEFTIFFAYSPWIYFLPPNHYEFTIFFAILLEIHHLESTIYFANSLWILNLFSEIHYEYSICFANLLFFHDFTMNSLSVSRMN